MLFCAFCGCFGVFGVTSCDYHVCLDCYINHDEKHCEFCTKEED